MLGQIIKNKRIELGLSQVYLSKLSGVDCKTISYIERNIRKKPIPETLFNLGDALELDIYSLFKTSGYTDEEMDLIFDDRERNYSFDFTITIEGNAYVSADNIQDAKDIAAKEIATELLNASNNNELLNDIFYDSKLSILIKVKEDWYIWI